MQSKSEHLNEVLTHLSRALPDVRGAVIATREGLPVARTFMDGVDAERVAAMSVTAVGLGQRLAASLNTGEMREVSVSGKDGHVFVYASGGKGVLGVITKPGANIALLHLEVRDAALAIAHML